MEADMNLTRMFAVVIALGVLSTASSGQETQPKPTAPPAAKPADAPPQSAPSQATPAQSAPTQQGETPPPPSASKPKTGVIKDDEFIPTQEIQPDEDVTFPVDL
jgi:hypothetical protein